jgi:hypothetical protein
MPRHADVDEYVASLEGWKADVVAALRQIVLDAAPGAEEAIKWSQPVYSTNGPCIYMKAFKNSVNFGFWWGVHLDDPKGLLQGTGEKMRHVKLTSVDDLDEEALARLVRQAVELNQTRGDPTRK